MVFEDLPLTFRLFLNIFQFTIAFKLLRKWNKEMSYENNENLFKLMQF